MDLSAPGMIHTKTSHTLHLCFLKTEMELCMFRGGAFAELKPMLLNEISIQFCDLPQDQMNNFYARRFFNLYENFS